MSAHTKKMSTGFAVVRVGGRMALPRHKATGAFPTLEEAEAWAVECKAMWPERDYGVLHPSGILTLPGEDPEDANA